MKKPLTVKELAKLGGHARAQKYTETAFRMGEERRTPEKGEAMKLPALFALMFLFSASVIAAPKQWKEGKVLGSQTETPNVLDTMTWGPNGGYAGPAGASQDTVYGIAADGIVYTVAYHFDTYTHFRNRPPVLTVNGKVKMLIDGPNLRIKDDNGKEYKLKILQKVAVP